MKIAIPILTFSKSGGHRVLAQLANNWTEQGHTVEIILCYESESYFPLDKRIRITHIKGRNVLDNFFRTAGYIRKKYNEYDVVIANQNRTAYYAFFGALPHFDFSKCYYYVQAYEPEFYSFGLKRGIENWLKPHAMLSYYLPLKKIVNSKLYFDYKNLHARRVVYPGLDLANYYPKELSCFHDTIRIGTIGRTEEWKGTADVCKAMEILRASGVDFEYYIAFNDFDTIEHKFVRPDGDENLAAFYRDMDIVVVACKGQLGAIHYPVIETMAVGTSIVCTDYFPSNDLNSYKVDCSAPEQIAEAVKKIIADKEEAVRKRRQALKDVQRFNWPIVAKRFLSYLKERDR